MATKNKYLKSFKDLRCGSEVIEAVRPVGDLKKELTESMGVLRTVKTPILKNPGVFSIIDIGAGHGLTGILAAYTLPVKKVLAVDKKKQVKEGHKNVQKWDYIEYLLDENYLAFYNEIRKHVDPPYIIVASHPCKDLARRCLGFTEWLNNNFPDMDESYASILLCCVGNLDSRSRRYGHVKMNTYALWANQLLEEFAYTKSYRDESIISPANIIIKSIGL